MSQLTNFGSGGGGGSVDSVTGGNNITITGTETDPIVNVSGASLDQLLVGLSDGSFAALAAGTDDQILTGVTGSAPVWVDPTGSSITIAGDAGSPATSDSFTFTGGTSGAVFTVDGINTITESFDYLSLPTTTSTVGQILIGGNRFIQAYGSAGIFSGNVSVGNGAGSLDVTAGNNIAFGSESLSNLTSGGDNTALGASSLSICSSGNGNVSVGSISLQSIDTGSYNIAIGYSAGNNYGAGENFNILIGSNEVGEFGESNVIRIGTAVASTCFIGGIDGVDVGSVATVVTESGNQLGSAVLTAGSGIDITPGTNIITISATGGNGIVTIDGDTGSATGSTVNIVGGSSGAVFTGDTVSTVTASFNYLALPTTDTTNGQITIDGSAVLHSFGGSTNLYLGGAGNFSANSPSGNFGAGYLALSAVVDGSNNIAIGESSLQSLDEGEGNVVLGNNGAGGQITSGNLNTIIGYAAGGNLIDGGQNIMIGVSAGSSLTGSESSNIIIGTGGFTGESTTIRIGDPSTITNCFVAGITGVTVSNTNFVTIDSMTGHLGSTSNPSAPWNTITSPTQQMDVNNNYIANNAVTLLFTLPATSPVGSMIKITGMFDTSGWSIAQNAGNTIYYDTQITTTGLGGSLSSTNTRDSVELVCVTADADWNVLSSVGTLTVV